MGEGSIWTKTQLAVFYVVILLAIDEINPVKVVLHVFPSLSRWHVATVSSGLMVYIFISDIKSLAYSGIKVFFLSTLSIFFRSVEVIGKQHVPRYGPVIYTVNHKNQMVDASMIVTTSDRPVGLLMAEASWRRPIIGHIAWALGVVPVKRAQDDAKPGTGTVTFSSPKVNDEEDTTIDVEGLDTKFTQEFKKGDKLRPKGTANGLKVIAIESDTKMVVDGGGIPDEFPTELFEDGAEPTKYDQLGRTPLTKVFGKVLDRLAGGGAVGIFPEGGSHDRTDLLPLKVGVALMAYSALEQDGLNVPIVPVGLSYFRAHRWRGRAVVEYGRPINLDPSTLDDFKAGGARRKKVCNELLEDIESAMRSVLVSTPDYETLEIIHTARRLYQSKKIGVNEKQDLNRRFAEGYKRLLLMTDGNPPAEWLDLQKRIESYRDELKDLGIKDYQVPTLAEEKLDKTTDRDGDDVLRFLQLLYNIVHMSTLVVLALVPILLLNLPVGVMAGIYAERRRKKALAQSSVKVKGYDVMLTEKIVFCLVMVPTLWAFYGLLLVYLSPFDGPTIALIVFAFPICAYLGISVAEAGIIELHDLRPHLMRVFPSTRKRLAALPAIRKKLREDLRAFVRSIGPALGEIYYGENLDWAKITEQSRGREEKAEESTEKGDQAKKTD